MAASSCTTAATWGRRLRAAAGPPTCSWLALLLLMLLAATLPVLASAAGCPHASGTMKLKGVASLLDHAAAALLPQGHPDVAAPAAAPGAAGAQRLLLGDADDVEAAAAPPPTPSGSSSAAAAGGDGGVSWSISGSWGNGSGWSVSGGWGAWYDDVDGDDNQQVRNSTVNADYHAAVRVLVAVYRGIVGNCSMSVDGMHYADVNGTVASTGSFFPAAVWLRAMFHDAGTYVRRRWPSKGSRGGPNGSLAVGCPDVSCGSTDSGYPKAYKVSGPSVVCPDNTTARSGFTDGSFACCPPGYCVVHTQGNDSDPNTKGKVVPACLRGTRSTTELCRPENDNLLGTIQFYRAFQMLPQFRPASGPLVSMADMMVIGAAVAVEMCSGGAVKPRIFLGRSDATAADDNSLPTTDAVISQRHNEIFAAMGLSETDMVTVVTGSHSIGGMRALASNATTCPFVPFDCTPSGQFGANPFDNNVYKVACNGVQGVTSAPCTFNARCTNPLVAEASCPFTPAVRAAFSACRPGVKSYPPPGLGSDAFFCQNKTGVTRQVMVDYAKNQTLFFRSYEPTFEKLAALGYNRWRKPLVLLRSA